MASANEILLKITADNKDVQKKLNETGRELNIFTKQTEQQAGKLANTFKKLGAIFSAYLGTAIIQSAMQSAKELVNLRTGFENLAASAEGGSKALLDAMQEASKGLLSQRDIMKSANLAIQLMGQDVIDKLPEMAKIATGIAMAQGKDAGEMLNDLVVAAGRQSVMILDNLGISSVRAGELMEEYAKKLGKTREQMTDAEKRAAFFYAAMKAGNEILLASGGIQETYGARMERLKATLDDIKDNTLMLLLPLFDALAQLLNDIGKAALWAVEKLNGLADWVARNETVLALLSTIPGMQPIAIGMRAKAIQEDYLKAMRGKTKGTVTGKATTPTTGAQAQKEYINYSKEFEEAAQKVAEGFEKVKQAAIAGDLTATAKAMEELQKQGLITANTNTAFAQNMAQMAYEAKVQNIAIDELSSAFSNLETATKQSIYEMMWGEKGWSKFQQAFKNIVKQIIADIAYLTIKMAALQAVMSATGLGTFGTGGGIVGKVLSKIFERGYIPTFAKGRIPAFPSGYIPQDHFLAYIGTKEAVMRKEATQANRDLLAWMNANNGQRLPLDINLTSVIQVDGNEIGRVVDKYRDTIQSLTGYKNYYRKSL